MKPVGEIELVPLSVDDAPALFAFEVKNRAWFEGWVGPRPDSYWELSSLEKIVQNQVDAGEWMYLVKSDGRILGRLNLTDEGNGVAQLGYRIGQDHVGRGVASKAVIQMVGKAPSLGLWALEARVLAGNDASYRVLEKTRFRITDERTLDGRALMIFRRDLDM
ncbi:GNAT family N-acetyltransferase [Aliiroseovarius lamellibrachiae]|uniref:GNAT family N-acetyltransferase n=1 Tax=Aliiroseovarius lamellibrachiae TaxID=1924933 RepID=UPI001BE0CE58|nr:GNAT family N-acetyltransferase [Aliiroseovarius lamellibrachiae]